MPFLAFMLDRRPNFVSPEGCPPDFWDIKARAEFIHYSLPVTTSHSTSFSNHSTTRVIMQNAERDISILVQSKPIISAFSLHSPGLRSDERARNVVDAGHHPVHPLRDGQRDAVRQVRERTAAGEPRGWSMAHRTVAVRASSLTNLSCRGTRWRVRDQSPSAG